MKNDCAYKEKCMRIMVMQMFAMYAGRSLACIPSCDDCNIYEPVEHDNIYEPVEHDKLKGLKCKIAAIDECFSERKEKK